MEKPPETPSALGSPRQVVLVDEGDNPVGVEEKLRAHEDGGKLHRAFSVFVFDSEGRMLLQRRSPEKYHFGGLWTNACCSHPAPGEDTPVAARAALGREMGFDAELERAFSFVYAAHDPASGLTEREYDHVFFADFDGEPDPDPEEADAWRWVETGELLEDLETHPERYTPWFGICARRAVEAREGRVPGHP